ncbi:MAG TPA: carbohydrate ABC transporter permease [Candidatus Hydrogenedentes bacterium]|nr:carbohydrate ABC transporter permease [Candidatus Hydrogenedentota bacterium]
MTGRGGKRRAGGAGYAALLGLGATVFGFPLYWMVRGAVIDQATWTRVPLVWFPGRDLITLDAFKEIFTSTQFRMGRVLLNTFALATMTMVCNVAFDCMAGFALAKMRVPGKKYVVVGLLITLMVPFEALMVPLYLVVTKLGLANTFPGIVLPGAASAFCIILMRQFFLSVPNDLIEAGVIDGADWGQIFARIAMPLAAPAVATVAVITFLAGWESYIWPLLITDPHSEFDVLQKVLAQATMVTQSGTMDTEFPWLMAAALISTVPVLLLFILCQRFFIAGLTGGALKG